MKPEQSNARNVKVVFMDVQHIRMINAMLYVFHNITLVTKRFFTSHNKRSIIKNTNNFMKVQRFLLTK